MTGEKRLRYIRSYFNISVVTMVLFLICFGIILINTFNESGTLTEDNGIGMAGIFLLPAALAVILLLICAYFLFWRKEKGISQTGFLLLSVLIIPVSLFGFILAVAVVRLLIGFIPHF